MSRLLFCGRNILERCTIVLPAFHSTREIKRWVYPTLRELRCRAVKAGPQKPEPRSGFVEWNYRSELFAFSKRLNEDFQLPLLQTAFTHRSYVLAEERRQRELDIKADDVKINDNRTLIEIGTRVAKDYVRAYLQHSLPKVPPEGRQAIEEFLLRVDTLAYISSRLGTKELIFSDAYPPTEETLANTLLAIIGALQQSSGLERALTFVRDFVCTHLNQQDLLEMWNIEDAHAMLKSVHKAKSLPEPEPRLLGDCGKNTVLAAYHVGIYANKEMIGEGFGEDIPTAIQAASLNALQDIFGIQDNMAPFNFRLNVEPKEYKDHTQRQQQQSIK